MDLKVNSPLTNVQAALLKRFARQVPDEQLEASHWARQGLYPSRFRKS